MTGNKSHSMTLVACVAKNGVIGKEGKLPWRIKEDMYHLNKLIEVPKSLVIVGQRTYDSMDYSFKDKIYSYHDLLIIDRINFYLLNKDFIKKLSSRNNIIVLGGRIVYSKCIKHADKLIITQLDKAYSGDCKFPKIPKEFKEVSSEKFSEGCFVTYEKCN